MNFQKNITDIGTFVRFQTTTESLFCKKNTFNSFNWKITIDSNLGIENALCSFLKHSLKYFHECERRLEKKHSNNVYRIDPDK